MPPPVPLTPETLITEIIVQIKTATVWWAGTDDQINICLFNLPGTGLFVYNLPDGDDYFENGNTDTFPIDLSYFQGRHVADINIVRLHKRKDHHTAGGWALAGLKVWVNGNLICDDPEGNPIKWLEHDDRDYYSTTFKPMPYTDPVLGPAQSAIVTPGDTFSVTVAVTGGKPFPTSPAFHWGLPVFSPAGFTNVRIQADSHDNRQATITGTASTDGAVWSGDVTVQDAQNKTVVMGLTLRCQATVPAPGITGVTPAFGWPSAPPAAEGASSLTVTGTNFYWKNKIPLTATMVGPNGTQLAATVLSKNATTVQVLIPDLAVTGPVTITTPSGSASTVPVVVHASAYRFRWGFPFTNRFDLGQDQDGFPDRFSWDRYVEAYGIPEMYVMVYGQPTVRDPWSEAMYLVTRGMISNGCCHGFSMQSLRMQQQVIGDLMLPTQQGGYPIQGTLFDLADGQNKPEDDLSHLIQVGQLAMLSSEAFGYYAIMYASTPMLSTFSTTMDARPMVADILLELKNNWDDPRMVAFAEGANPFNGHVVVPFRVNPHTGVVNCYNCDRPALTGTLSDESITSFTVDPATGNWSFNMGTQASPQIWHGIYCFPIPLSAYGHQDHWSILSPLGLAKAVIGYLGSCIGGPGAIVEPVGNGVKPLPTWAPRPVHAITGQTSTLRITSNDGPALCSIILASGVALSIEEVHGTVVVDLDLTAGTVRLTEQHLQSDIRPLLRVVRRDAARSVSSSFAVRASAGTPTGVVGLGLASDTPAIFAAHPGVDLYARRLDGLANDTVTELTAVSNAVANGTSMLLQQDGTLALVGAGGVAKDLSALRRPRVTVPTHVALGDGPVTAKLRRNGGLSRPVGSPPSAPQSAAASAVQAAAAGGIQTAPDLARRVLNPLTPAVQASVASGIQTAVDATRLIASGPGSIIHFPRSSGMLPVDLGPEAQWLVVRDSPSHGGSLQVRGTEGTQVFSVVHERDGYRSFPRTVSVAVPSSTSPAHSACVVLAEQPGIAKAPPMPIGQVPINAAFAAVPLTLAATGESLTALTLVVETATRLSAPEDQVANARMALRPNPPDLALSPQLTALGAQLTRAVQGSGKALFGISLPASAPVTGRVALGSLTVPVLRSPGSVWTASGIASAHTADGRDIDVHFVGVEVREPGDLFNTPIGQGPVQRAGIKLSGSPAEGETISLSLAGFPSRTSGVGWWVTSFGGEGQILHPAGTSAQLMGVMAGPIRIHALAGSDVLTADVLVEARVGWSAALKASKPKPNLVVNPSTLGFTAGGAPRIRDAEALLAPIWNPGDPAAAMMNSVDLGIDGVVRINTAVAPQ